MDITVQKKGAFQEFSEDFLSYSPYSEEAGELSRNAALSKSYPRAELSSILEVYNRSIDNDDSALQQIRRLKNPDSVCVMTGQQLGFMGGPFYTILKGISCLLLAKEIQAVPVFWLATEDHDVHEIDHTYLLDPLGNLQEFKLKFGKTQQAVEDLQLNHLDQEVIEEFCLAARLPSIKISEGGSYSQCMASLMAKLFRGTGLVFLEPKILRRLAQPFISRELKEHQAILALLQKTTNQLMHRGMPAPLPVDRSPQLFFIHEGKREKILALNTSEFQIGSQKVSLQKLEETLEKKPENFSVNAASRPILQTSLFPTIAYVAGPNEINYHRQLKEYYLFHGVHMPWIVPRLSATLVTVQGREILEKLSLDPWQPIPSHWLELMPELQKDLHFLQGEWEHSGLKLFSEDLPEKTLKRNLRQLFAKLQKSIISRRLKSRKIPSFALHYLRNLLHPHNQAQERVLNWHTFQSASKENLVLKCIESLKWNIQGHIYLSLNC